MPDLPERYREFRELGPIEAKIIKINADRTVVLDQGTTGRLRKGMVLGAWSFDAEVISVTDDHAVARLWYYAGSEMGPEVGGLVTSGRDGVHPRPTSAKRYPYLVDVPQGG